MPKPASDAAPVPIPAADALYTDTLRVAERCYERGDYRRAAALFQDAAAVGGYRPEAQIWAVLGAHIDALIADGTLVSRDAAFTSPAEVRA